MATKQDIKFWKQIGKLDQRFEYIEKELVSLSDAVRWIDVRLSELIAEVRDLPVREK